MSGDSGGEQKRTGAALLFHVFITRLLTLIALNLLFCVSALPLVTLPNALAALCRCAGLVLREEDFPLLRTYWAAFASEFLKTLAAGWVILLLFFGAVYGAVYYLQAGAFVTLLFSALCAAAGAILYLASCNLFYLLSRVRLPLGALLKNAFFLTFLQPPGKTAICLASCIVTAVCAWRFPAALPVLLTIAFSLSALLSCYAVRDKIEQSVVS